ncbi:MULTISPECIES: helix-turn-helix domain-containing protein [unclassified Listeria]|uniref:helix-turn-helix domain-containing protein n=1 Tax=unclassified Listeria TaxID=2642072 RepID=UPI000B58729A|nr:MULTISPECIES: helix-turn-helix transcriptional regulator [unclassified Listeria]
MDDLNQILVDCLKKVRTRLKISQEKLSLKAELDRHYVNKLENGRFSLSVPSLDRLIKGLGISYQEFFDFNREDNDALEKVDGLSPKEKEDLLVQCIKISDLLKKE